jgi:hypothetical protein
VATNDARLDGAHIAVDEPQPRVVRDVRERCFAEREAIEDGGAVTRGEQLGDEGRPNIARAAGDRFLRRIDPNDASYAEPLSVPALLTVLVRTGVSTY